MNIFKIKAKYLILFCLISSKLFAAAPIDSNQTYYNNTKAINPFFLQSDFSTSDPTAALFGTALIGILNYEIIKDDIKKHNQDKSIDFEFLKKVEQSIKNREQK